MSGPGLAVSAWGACRTHPHAGGGPFLLGSPSLFWPGVWAAAFLKAALPWTVDCVFGDATKVFKKVDCEPELVADRAGGGSGDSKLTRVSGASVGRPLLLKTSPF